MRKHKLLAVLVALVLLAQATLAAENLAELKAGYEAAVKAAAAAPSSYEANWKAAMAARKYGDFLVGEGLAGWKETARAAAKDGMKYGEIAFKLSPTGIEGWYWYGLCVGTYSDCVSIITALAEGLKGRTQQGFENAYKFNKMYDNGGPIIALGRFWQSIPAIAGQDRKKAEQLYDEYISLFIGNPSANSDAWYYRGELYKDTNRPAQAKADLAKAASMGNKDAAALLAKLK